jgi:hypothetical protein
VSLLDRLRARELPSVTVGIPVDAVAYARLDGELAQATWRLEDARGRVGGDVAVLRAEQAAAQAALDACPVEAVVLRALPPAEWEALVDAHPPTEEQMNGGAQWNVATFRPALLAVSVVVDSDDDAMTESDWAALAKEGALAAGELGALFHAAVTLNLRGPSASVGKDR